MLRWTLILCSLLRIEAFFPPQPRDVGSNTLLWAQTTKTQTDRLKRIDSLNEWGKSCDIKLGGVGIAPTESAGLGLVATQNLSPNALVLSVPSNVVLSVESPGGGPNYEMKNVDRKALRELPWFAQFSLYLHSLDKVSSVKRDLDMRPWLDSLPKSFDTPLHWNSDARNELQYSHLVKVVERQEMEWKRLYEKALPSLDMTLQDFVWGCECARSRAFSGGYTGSAFNPLVYAFTLLLVTAYVGLNLGTLQQAANGAALVVCASILSDFVLPKLLKVKKYVICPIMDMANHESNASAEVSFEYFGDCYSLATTSNVKNGEEVCISYGARSNDQLLQYYGFVERDNPHDVYVMPALGTWDIAALEQACGRQFPTGRLKKLNRAGLLGSTNENVSSDEGNPEGGVMITRAGGLDPAVMQALRALVSTDSEWQTAGEAVGNFAAEVNAENERLALLAAKTAIELELASKPTTLQQDEALLKSTKTMDTSREERLAIEFRIEKKKLLAEILEKLN